MGLLIVLEEGCFNRKQGIKAAEGEGQASARSGASVDLPSKAEVRSRLLLVYYQQRHLPGTLTLCALSSGKILGGTLGFLSTKAE